MTNYSNEIGKRICDLRTLANETQEDLANFLNCNRASVANYENGKRTPDANTIIKIAKHYNTTTDYILGVTDNITNNTELQAVCNYMNLSEKAVIQLMDGRYFNDEVIFLSSNKYLLNKKIQNEILSKNIVFEIASYIVECKTLYKRALSDVNNLEKINDYEMMINGIMFKLVSYVADIAKSECDDEIKKFELINKEKSVDSLEEFAKELIKNATYEDLEIYLNQIKKMRKELEFENDKN